MLPRKLVIKQQFLKEVYAYRNDSNERPGRLLNFSILYLGA